MDKNVYPNQEVGNFFNRNFISVKIDAEKGEGIELAKKYGANSYPTHVFLNSKGEFSYKTSGGGNAASFIRMGKTALSSNSNELVEKMKAFDKGEIKSSELLSFIKLLYEVELDCSEPLAMYLKTLSKSELISENGFKIIRKYAARNVNNEAFNYLIKYYKEYCNKVGDKKMNQYMFGRYIFQCYENNRAHKNNATLYKFLKDAGIPFDQALKESYELVVYCLKDPNKFDEYISRSKKLFAEYPYTMYNVMNECVKAAYRNQELEIYTNSVLKKLQAYESNHAAKVASHFATIISLNARDYERAYKYALMAYEWADDNSYLESSMKFYRKTLGIDRPETYQKKMPLFTLKDITGKEVALSDFKGKYVLIDFWASWCGPCKGEVPYLKAAYEKFKNKGVVFISITVDESDEDWKNAVKHDGMNWIQLKAKGTTTIKDWGVRGYPRILLLDKDRKIFGDNLRGNSIERDIKLLFKRDQTN